MRRCGECGQRKPDIPLLVQYLDADSLDLTSERQTCMDCWRRIRGNMRLISNGPMVKRNKYRYTRMTIVGESNKYQMEWF